MNKPIHPAVAEHVMEENEKLRGLLRDALPHVASSCRAHNDRLINEIDAALSQQAEPAETTDTYTAVDMATAAAQGFRDGQKAEPAPAQDEREAFERFAEERHYSTKTDNIGYCHPGTTEISRAFKAGAAWQRNRPAQTEQQPVSWQFYQDGKWWNGGDRIKDHRKNTEAAGIPVRDLYAASIAQTAPQPEQSGLMEALRSFVNLSEQRLHELGELSPEMMDCLRKGRAALAAQRGDA